MGDPETLESFDEPITGWRAWNLSEEPAAGPLLHPVTRHEDPWLPRRAVEARCEASLLIPAAWRRHEAPDPGCTCGIYAARSIEEFDRPRPAWLPPPVIGTVSLWGRVVEHESGWRGALAYPARLRLVCAMCAWFEPGPGTPVVVHRFGKLLYTLCEVHRGGIQVPDGRRSAPTDLDPDGLQARLLDAYAVEVLPPEQVEALFHLPRTPEPPAFWPSIRVVGPRE